LEWPRVDFIFSREGLMEQNGVISLYEHADSLTKVTTVRVLPRVLPEYSEIRWPNSEIQEIKKTHALAPPGEYDGTFSATPTIQTVATFTVATSISSDIALFYFREVERE